jgi:hypothetical protein
MFQAAMQLPLNPAEEVKRIKVPHETGSGGMGASVQGVWGPRFGRYGGFGSGRLPLYLP